MIKANMKSEVEIMKYKFVDYHFLTINYHQIIQT